MNPIISLIAPAYNVEKYIEACVHSCENQDLPRDSYEIIIVNDGSTDSTYSTIERLSGVYENIRIVTQKNQGLSVARNNGFKLARGKYVWFIDSDDCISSNCLGKCKEMIWMLWSLLLQFRLGRYFLTNSIQKRTCQKFMMEKVFY
mgnify:CR=1 FL=1